MKRIERAGGMMNRRSFSLAAALLPLALALGGCGDDRWHDYNYRMTVYAGGKAFSTVRHVELTEGATIQDSSGRLVDRRVTGEAVVIETPTGPVFALMTPEDGQFGLGYYAAYVAEPALVPAIGKPPESDVQQAVREWREQQPGFDGLADDAAQHNAMLEVAGPRTLPRTIPYPGRPGARTTVWPLFVRFGDIDDPRTVRQVTPESIGVTRITIEVTDEDVTTGIEKRLGWLDAYYDKMLDGQRLNNSKALANNLTPRAFRQEPKS